MGKHIRTTSYIARAKENKYYQKRLEAVQQLAPAYYALLDSLAPQQRQVLEDYLNACEDLDQELLSRAASFAGESRTQEIYCLLKIDATYTELRRWVREQHQNLTSH